MPAKVTRRGSPPLQQVAASVASRARHGKAPRPGRKYVPRVMAAEAPRAVLLTNTSHETMPAATAASLAIGPRNVNSHDTARPTSHRCRSRLCS